MFDKYDKNSTAKTEEILKKIDDKFNFEDDA